MNALLQVNWAELFLPKLSLLEILIRGTGVYLALCLLLRVVLKRQAGKVGLGDLLVVAIVAGVCRNPLIADAYSIPDGLGVVIVVLGWSYALDWLSYHFPLVHALTHPHPVQLIRDGVVLKENLRRELMTEKQLECQLRQQGVREPTEVAEAWIEGSGTVSVIRKQPGPSIETALPSPTAARGADPAPGATDNTSARQCPPAAAARPESAEDFVAALDRFFAAAHTLEERIAWHDQQRAQHAAQTVALRRVLAQFGYHVKAGSKRRLERLGREANGVTATPSSTAAPLRGGQVPGKEARD